MVLLAVLVGQLAEHDRHLAVLARAVNDEDRLAARRKTVFRGGEIGGSGYVRAVQPMMISPLQRPATLAGPPSSTAYTCTPGTMALLSEPL